MRDDAVPDVGHLLEWHPGVPSRWAIIGFVDRPPPTQTSKPGPCSGWRTPTNDDVVDLVDDVLWATRAIAVLNLRGRFDVRGSPM